jgi:hypothetical protein
MHPVRALLAGLALLTVAAPVAAHHSFAAEYDRAKPVDLRGKVLEIEWVNPHAWIHMEVAGVKWSCELGSPNILMRNGWRRDTLKPGDEIVIEGFAAKDGSNMANARTVKLATGERVFNAGSSGDAGTPGAPNSKQ